MTLQDTSVREDLHGIWADSPGDVYACGLAGTLIHFDGSAWKRVDTPTREDLYAVWASSPDDIFVAGTAGQILNRAGNSWTSYDVAPGHRFHALWGYSHDEVYAGGSRGAFYRFDGSAWARVIVYGDPTYAAEVLDLWGPAPAAVSLLDRYGIQWFNGTAWNARQALNFNANGLWGFSLDQQVSVGAGVSTFWTNAPPEPISTPTEEPLYDVWDTAMDSLYAVGRDGNIARFDGAVWTAMNAGALDDMNDLWVTLTGAIAVGDSGRVLRGNGSAWSEETVGSQYELDGVWDSGDGLTVAVGRYSPDQVSWRQAILTNNGSGWSDVAPIGTAPVLFDVWGSSAGDVYTVGWAGEILHYDGNTWGVADPGGGEAAFLLSISGSSPSNVIAVGRTNDLRGLIRRYNGTTWTTTILPHVEELDAVWVENPTSAFAVGSFGAIRRYDGSKWSSMKSPTRESLFCVCGTSFSDVYAAGWEGTMIHFDGEAWQALLPTTNRTINAISGRSPSEIYLAGDRGAIWLFGGMDAQVTRH